MPKKKKTTKKKGFKNLSAELTKVCNNRQPEYCNTHMTAKL